MTRFSQVFRRIRSQGAMRAAAALALAVQLLVPVVHGQEAAFGNVPDRSTFELSANHAASSVAAHDAEKCVQCRLASQVRSLDLPVLAVAGSVVLPSVLELPGRLDPARPVALASASPRAPPLRG